MWDVSFGVIIIAKSDGLFIVQWKSSWSGKILFVEEGYMPFYYLTARYVNSAQYSL